MVFYGSVKRLVIALIGIFANHVSQLVLLIRSYKIKIEGYKQLLSYLSSAQNASLFWMLRVIEPFRELQYCYFQLFFIASLQNIYRLLIII